MKFGFSIEGLIIFLLPMLINILYFIFPSSTSQNEIPTKYKKLEKIEQSTRIIFAILICILICTENLSYTSPFFYLSILFLILYYIVWIRYFIGGRDIKLLASNFLFIPMPLAIFPVLYFIFASMWLKNYLATVVMIIFGIAHNIISYNSLHR